MIWAGLWAQNRDYLERIEGERWRLLLPCWERKEEKKPKLEHLRRGGGLGADSGKITEGRTWPHI